MNASTAAPRPGTRSVAAPRSGRRWLTALCTWLALGGGLSGCSGGEPHDMPLSAPLRVGILPTDASSELERRFEPLRTHLAAELGVPTELVLAGSYKELLTLFQQRDVDLALFGAYTFVLAQRRDGAVPIVMSDVNEHYSTVFLVPAGSPARTLEDLRGKTIAFGSRLSTSGHLMPRSHLVDRGIVPETDLRQVRYSGRHDRTALWVRDGLADVGAIDARVFRQMIADGRLDPHAVRVLDQTRPYPDYVWAAQSGLSRAAHSQLRDAFLKLSVANPEHARILGLLGAEHFLPTELADFAEVQAVLERLGASVPTS